jgi:hypothetical protein
LFTFLTVAAAAAVDACSPQALAILGSWVGLLGNQTRLVDDGKGVAAAYFKLVSSVAFFKLQTWTGEAGSLTK